jgi:hypothetical protein
VRPVAVGAGGVRARRLDRHLLARDPGAPLQRAHAVPRRRDRRPGEDVVELAEEEVLPGGVEAGVQCQALPGGRERVDRRARRRQLPLAAPLGALDVAHHAVAARERVLELRLHDGQAGARDGVEERLRVREAQLDPVERVAVLEDPLDVGARRPAAVVADAVEAHRVPDRRVGRLGGEQHLPAQVAAARHVARDDPEREHLAAPGAAPVERGRRQGDLRRVRAVEDVGLHALRGEQVGQRRRVPERVDVVGHPRRRAEALREVAAPVAQLAPPALGGRQVGVGLDDHPARRVPAPGRDELVHARRQLRVDPLDPAVQPRLAAGVDQLGVLVAAVGRRPEARQGLVDPGGPAPQPHGIDVGVAHHVDHHRNGPYPLSAPATKAPTMNLCSATKTTITGRIARMPPAARMPVLLAA